MEGILFEPSFTPRQILDDPSALARVHDAKACKLLAAAARYVAFTLTGPDPLLGRSGAICPFVGSALLENMITLSVLPPRITDTGGLRQAALAVKRLFEPVAGRTATRAESLRASIMLLPHVDPADAASMIETVQKELKPDMVASGLMIGEFFPGCAAPGLNNPAFRPADTAFAFLAIRRMAAADLPFLVEDSALLAAYLARFGDDGRRRLARLRQDAFIRPSPAELQAGIVAHATMPGGIAQHATHAG